MKLIIAQGTTSPFVTTELDDHKRIYLQKKVFDDSSSRQAYA
jgi:hypothetical protein